LEAFIVHMSMAWLRLMQARTEMTDGDLYERTKDNRRVRGKDSEWKMKPLSTLTDVLLQQDDPRRSNLRFFTGLRNKIEHRYEKDIAALVAGRTQAYVLNYERTLVDWFGVKESMANELRFPLFVSSITGDAVKALKEVNKRAPRAVKEWIRDFDANLDSDVSADQAFDFHVYLVPHTGPKTEADAAMTFVKLDELDDDQRAVMDQVQTIIRNKRVPVANLDRLKPSDVARRVCAGLGQPFSVNDHTQAWRHYGVRPPSGSSNPEVTIGDFCLWDDTFKQYVYTEAWAAHLIRHLGDPDMYTKICRRPQTTGAATTGASA